MPRSRLIREISIILCLGLSFIQSKNLETKQGLTKKIQQINKIDRYEGNYNKDWTGDVRIVNISAGADEEFIDKYGDSWKSRIDKYIKEASENYHRNFGIKFRILEYIEWKSDDFSDYSNLLDDIKKIGINGDIFVAYTKQPDYMVLGIAEHKFAIVEDTWYKCTMYVTNHEIGHLFDLNHVPESWSFMNRFVNFCHPSLAGWDELSRERLLKNKYKYFE